MDQNKLEVFVRSQMLNAEVIRVIYLGKKQGWHYGKIIDAKARFVKGTGKPFPFPKKMYSQYQIIDEDYDLYTVSADGINFEKDWYPIPALSSIDQLLEKEKHNEKN